MRIIISILIIYTLYVWLGSQSTYSRLDYRYNIQRLVLDGRYVEASQEIEYFSEFDPTLSEDFKIVSDQLNSYSYMAKQVFLGVFGGNENGTQITTNVLVSFFLIGDVIDFSRETFNLATNNESDKVILALSALGLASTAALPAKPGINFTKILYKARFLPDWFIKAIINGSMNITVFTKISSSIKDIGCFNTARILKHSKSSADLDEIFKVAKIMGKDTGIYLKYRVNIDTMDRLLLKLSTILNKANNLKHIPPNYVPYLQKIILLERTAKAGYKSLELVDINKTIKDYGIYILSILSFFLLLKRKE